VEIGTLGTTARLWVALVRWGGRKGVKVDLLSYPPRGQTLLECTGRSSWGAEITHKLFRSEPTYPKMSYDNIRMRTPNVVCRAHKTECGPLESTASEGQRQRIPFRV